MSVSIRCAWFFKKIILKVTELDKCQDLEYLNPLKGSRKGHKCILSPVWNMWNSCILISVLHYAMLFQSVLFYTILPCAKLCYVILW